MARSSLLTHWTGKDLCTRPADLTDATREAYLERLLSTLRGGFWMTVPPEELVGSAGPRGPAKIHYATPMTCFTELRLSLAPSHAARYGLLGIVVDRLFVLHRSGGPVHYVRSHSDEPVVGNLAIMVEWLDQQIKSGIPGAQHMMNAVWFQAGFLKAMSSADQDDFALLEEQEWRINHNDREQQLGRLVATGKETPRYKIPSAGTTSRCSSCPTSLLATHC